MPDQSAQSAPRLDTATRLAYDRTRLAYENTMMAWVRTATSLITFGFTIYKFFQLEMRGGEQTPFLVGPREFALLLVGIGLASLALATWEHRQYIQLLEAEHINSPRSLAGVVAALVAILGMLAFIVMLLRQ